MFGLSELAIILIVVIAVIAAKKGPDLARSAGKAARILKAEGRAMKEPEPKAAEPHIIPGEPAAPASTEGPRPSEGGPRL
ncbi:twin-arginine translocase TatA/TatE family subunit [Streptomyces sp. NPDC091377]|uniref:twin-arginine translocase TatA/TatE family subunit n=1 Tax=unclassified Streptomyces TaxID=2593676 RepID=UPI00382DCBE6